jgi:hypothetical protein
VWASAFAAQFSHVALSFAAGVMVPSKTIIEYPTNGRGPLAKVPLPPAILFILVNGLFCCYVLFICLRMDTTGPLLEDRKGRKVKAVRLGQMRLTSSAALVYELFCAMPDIDADKSGSRDSDSLLELDGFEEVRIRMGVVEKESGQDEAPGFRFGMSTRSLTQPLDEVQGVVVL